MAGLRLAIDYAIVHILAQSPSLEEAGPRILASIGETLGWNFGGLWEVDRDSEVLRCITTWCTEGVDATSFEQLSRSIGLAPGVGLPGRTWARGEPTWIADVTQESNFPRSGAAAEAGLRGAVGFPITDAAGILGVIEFFSNQVHEPEPELRELMEIAGSQVGQFIERKRIEEEISQSEALKTAILESSFDCLIAMDHLGRIIEFNPTAERTFGYTREEVVGREAADLIIPPHLRDRHRRGLERLRAGGDGPILGKRIEMPAMRADGSEFPVELAITRVENADPPVFTGYVRDVTERRRNEAALRFLVEASAALDASLDVDTTLHTIARLTIPYLADGCMVDLLEEDGSIRRVGTATSDPSNEPVLQELQRHRIDPNGDHPIARVMRSGRTEIVQDVSESFRKEISETEEYYQALRRWPARSVVVAPLRSRGKVLGTVSLASFTPERAYGLEQISVIEELASRAAKAVDNSLLYRDRARIARSLEQSLLPPRLPVVAGLELAARFQPAGGGGEVGGDFYDVFSMGADTWAITVGDVSGRGIDAAALTVLARHTIRAVATQEQRPAQILRILNETLRGQVEDMSFCSAVLGVLKLGGPRARLSLAIGGHPRPLRLRPSGDVDAIGSYGTLLGVVPDPELEDTELTLEQDDALVFYTNGVAEVRGPESRFGLEELVELVATCRERDALATAECIEDAVMESHDGNLLDDAAVLVAKISYSAGANEAG